MAKERREKEPSLPEGYSFQHRDMQTYKNRLTVRDQRDFMIAVQIADFQNDWDLINPNGEIISRVSGKGRRKAIKMAWNQEKFQKE